MPTDADAIGFGDAEIHEHIDGRLAAGHELLLHIPMEPGSLDVDPGPNVLLTGIPRQELLTSLKWNLDQFSGYVGVNNHMGSRFTADLAGMVAVMEELKKRKLFFLDSITAGNSVARKAARKVGLPFAGRNVFLDHADDVVEITKRLVEVERLAKRTGLAIAIGHPLGATGARLVPTVGHELRRSGKRYGLATQCIGAGMGISTIIEAL